MRLGLMITALASCLHAQNIAGDWHGTLTAGPAGLRLVLHFSKSGNGSLTGTLDSIDQGANGIPITTVSFSDSKLVFRVDAVNGTYTGTVNGDATAIDGTWSQGQPLDLNLRRGTFPKIEHKPAKPTDIDGNWQLTLDTGAQKIKGVLHITNTDDGLIATMDIPEQGAMGLPVTTVNRNGSSFKLEMKQLAGTFDGKISDDLTTIEGSWTQNGMTMSLVLKREKKAASTSPHAPLSPRVAD